jgi:membrane fusion protein (multidrug efflux system)
MRQRRFVLLALLVLLPLTACGAPPKEEVETTAAVPVSVQAARRGAIHRVVQATGIVKPATGAELLVTAPQSARIVEMPKGVGERVRRGDLLVRFDIPALQADAASRRADVARGQSRLTVARANFDRLRGLFERGIAARREVDDAKRELSDAEASLAESTTARSSAADLATRAVVRAPFDGIVAERTHNPGDLVEPGTDTVLRLIDPARLQVEAPVPLDQLAGIAVGNAARVRGPGDATSGDGGGRPAKVIARPPAVDPTTSSASVRLAFTGGTDLPAGTPVQVEIAGEEHRDTVIVPSAAVVQEGPRSFVYTVDAQNHAHRVEVRLGITAGPDSEILSGMAAGAPVVVQGQNGLPDGATVTTAPAAASPEEPAGTEPAP